MVNGAPFANTDKSRHAGRTTDVHGATSPAKLLNNADLTWVKEQHISAFTVNAGGSTAVLVLPDANTLGGYRLNNVADLLYFGFHVHDDWNGNSDLEVQVEFEVGIDNSGGGAGDTIDLSLALFYKAVGGVANKTQVIEVATVVGQAAQYKRFTAVFVVDWDLLANVVLADDVFSAILHLETDTSEVDNVIINHMVFHYHETQPVPAA